MKKIELLLLFSIVDCFSSKQLNHLRKEKLVNNVVEQPKSSNPPAGPYCQNIVGYYVGKFDGKRQASFNAEFQVSLDADLTKEKIHTRVDHWNEQVSKSSDFQLDFYYGTHQKYCEIDDDDCSESFTESPTKFKLDIDYEDGSFYHLMYFPYFNNSFALTNAVNGCTLHQLKGLNDSYVPNFEDMSFCVCCGSYNPDPLLGCPTNPWTQQQTVRPTRYPIVPTTQQTPGRIECKNLIARFSGTFQNKKFPDVKIDIDFQVSLSAKDNEKRNYFTMDYWNNNRTKMSDIELWASDEQDGAFVCDPVNNTNCFLPYVTQNSYFFLYIYYYLNNEYQNFFDFLYFENFNNSFSFDSIGGGKCTNNVPSYPGGYGPNTSLFNACICCDDYSPDSSLNCPYNPMAQTVLPTLVPTTQKPSKTVTCKNLIARFNGTFKNNYPNKLNVDFQVSLNAKDDEKRTYATMNYWNNDIVKTSDIDFGGFDDQHGWIQCDPVNSTDCSIPYVTRNSYFFLDIDYYSNNAWQNTFDFLYFENFNNSFTFDAVNAVGNCTNNVLSRPYSSGPNTTLFNACMCCDDYSPDVSLNCPVA